MGKPLRCRLGAHRWREAWDDENHIPVEDCELCGLRRKSDRDPPDWAQHVHGG